MGSVNPYRALGQRAEEEEERARIALITHSGDVRSLVDLLPFLPAHAHRFGPEASRAALSVLARCSPLQLAWLDQWYRGGRFAARSPAPPTPTWNDLQLGSPEWAREHRGVVALASFHRNGFVRERAVRLLGESDDGFELPYLLIRTNDWVANVHTAALAVVRRRVTPSYAPHWLHSLGLIDRLRAPQRREADLARLVRDVDALLLQAEVRPLLATALSKGELSVRRAALRLALSLPPRDGKALLLLALRDHDPLIVTESAKALLGRAPIDDAAALVDSTIRHPLATVRALALDAALRHEIPDVIPALRRALFDDARSIREVARHELSKRDSSLEFASDYRRALGACTGRDRAVAAEGLAEVGSRDDTPLFLEFFHDPHARVRAAAIVGIGRCDGSNHLDELALALRDRSSFVRRTVTHYAKLHLGRSYIQRVRRELREGG